MKKIALRRGSGLNEVLLTQYEVSCGHEVSFGYEVKFALIRVSELHTRSVLHRHQPISLAQQGKFR